MPAGPKFAIAACRSRRVPELDIETYRPQDTTPLYDAIGQTLMAARQEAPAEFKKLCVILTDGMENSSKEYTRKQIFALIKTCEREGWRFVYLGADHDVWAAGEDLGIAVESRVAFSKDGHRADVLPAVEHECGLSERKKEFGSGVSPNGEVAIREGSEDAE